MTAARATAGARRLDAVREQMDEAGVDLLLVYGNGRHHLLRGNLAWRLSGLRQMGVDLIVAVARDEPPVLVTAPEWDRARAERQSWIDVVIAADDVPQAVQELVDRRRWRATTWGSAGLGSASAATFERVHAAFAQAPKSMDVSVRSAAAIHDNYSQACLAKATEIAETGYRKLLQVARPGLAEYELAADVDACIRDAGADDNFQLLSASQHNRAVHAPTERRLGVGDVILGEISPSFDGQFAQICRSAVIGAVDERKREAYALLREAFDAGFDCVGPGVPIAEVTRAVNAVVIEHGYEQYTKPPYMRTRGHAMGLGGMMPADVSERSDVVLRPGMSFVLHPNQYLPDVGYFLCGEQVIVTEDGARVLCSRLPMLDQIEVRA